MAAKAAGDHTGNILDVHGLRIESSLSNNFSNFQGFVDTQGEEMRIEANMTLDQVRSKTVGFILFFFSQKVFSSENYHSKFLF